jgi:hypothetical protein
LCAAWQAPVVTAFHHSAGIVKLLPPAAKRAEALANQGLALAAGASACVRGGFADGFSPPQMASK